MNYAIEAGEAAVLYAECSHANARHPMVTAFIIVDGNPSHEIEFSHN
jgi:hypothetical protein